ncbi:CPBP family intramembrane metalloprotease [Patescibacteria group bacterium]|nr:CPBP family intramembrane metalloprotease [Patescibacteria group bacterium]
MKAEEKEEYNPIGKTIFCAFVLLVVSVIVPSILPFQVFSFWHSQTSFMDWMRAGIPVFIWGVSLGTFIHIWRTLAGDTEGVEKLSREFSLGQIFVHGVFTSVRAGLFEEIMFRWIIFLGAIVTGKVMNFLLFGFCSNGLLAWFHLNIAGPVADVTTFHYLHPYLFHPSGWAVGAAILGTNAFFRDGHRYQGFIGYVNSWFVGMFLFHIFFVHGLVAAILIHVIYDLLLDVLLTTRIALYRL